jgi:hypothetical protein
MDRAPASQSPQSTTVDDDTFCVQCDYNLRGLDREGKCPECARPVADSIRILHFTGADAQCLRSMFWGTAMLAALPVALILVPMLARSLDTWAWLFLFMLHFVGQWLCAASPSPASDNPEWREDRVAIRRFVFAQAIGSTLLVAALANRSAAEAFCIAVVLLILIAFTTLRLGRCYEDVMRRLPGRGYVADEAKSLFALLAWSIGLGGALAGFVGIAASVAFGPACFIFPFLAGIALMFAFSFLAAWMLLLRIMTAVRARLRVIG